MPNKNYLSGVRFERETMKSYEAQGYKCIRASGSHGEYDIVAYRANHKPVLIQCKVVTKKAAVDLMIKRFIEEVPSELHYHQSLRVKLKGSKVPNEVIV